MAYVTIEEARAQLPCVGDVRWETMTLFKQSCGLTGTDRPQRCTVVEVNRDHLWYTVQFENGFRECYKVPRLKPIGGGRRV